MKPGPGSAKVLDAWAVLAWIYGEEPAVAEVTVLLERAAAGAITLSMSMVNIGEVYYRLAKRSGRERATAFWEDFQTTPVRILPVPNSLILEAAHWKSRYPISYADAFAVATAIREQAVLVSGDPDFRALADAGDVQLEWIGR